MYLFYFRSTSIFSTVTAGQILPFGETCKLYYNETNNSRAEASHVLCNSLLRVQMARNTRAVNVNIQRSRTHGASDF